MTTQVIVLNGGSSSGKSTLVRRLQDELAEEWLSISVDTFVDALPPRLTASDAGIDIGDDGGVTVGPVFRRLETVWMHGIAEMARRGAHVIIDEVFLGGPASRRRWQAALTGLDVVWVGVRCDAEVAAAREAGRGDRPAGMAASQAVSVHRDMDYDVEVDTTAASAAECARVIAKRIV